MVLDVTLVNTQHYKVGIKGTVKQSRERSSALPYTLVSQPLKMESWSRPRLWSPTLLFSIYIYIYIYKTVFNPVNHELGTIPIRTIKIFLKKNIRFMIIFPKNKKQHRSHQDNKFISILLKSIDINQCSKKWTSSIFHPVEKHWYKLIHKKFTGLVATALNSVNTMSTVLDDNLAHVMIR